MAVSDDEEIARDIWNSLLTFSRIARASQSCWFLPDDPRFLPLLLFFPFQVLPSPVRFFPTPLFLCFFSHCLSPTVSLMLFFPQYAVLFFVCFTCFFFLV